MDTLEFTNTGTKLSLESINKIEQKYNIQFPISYINFLLIRNGGIPNKKYFITSESELVISFFFSLGAKDNSLESYIEQFKIESNYIPSYLLPIAEDAFGNIICISCAKEGNGNIYFCDHEHPGATHIIANSLDSFLENLKEDIKRI